jgi:hypothetical protein
LQNGLKALRFIPVDIEIAACGAILVR